MLSRFIQVQTLEAGLPNTVGVLTSSIGFVRGMEVGLFGGGLIAGFASDSGHIPHKVLGCMVIGCGLGCGVMGGLSCYFGGFGITNLCLKAFPVMNSKRFPLLVATPTANAALFTVCATILGGRRLQKLGYLSKRHY
jgi:hypothetical protein